MKQTMHKLAMFAALLAFCVIVLGAWVRLSHACLLYTSPSPRDKF